jgi:hypothetical protein
MSFKLTKSQIVNNYRAGVGLPPLPQDERPSVRSLFSKPKNTTPDVDVFTAKNLSISTRSKLSEKLEHITRQHGRGKNSSNISRFMNCMRYGTSGVPLPNHDATLSPSKLKEILMTYSAAPSDREFIPYDQRLNNVGKAGRLVAFDMTNKIKNPNHSYRYIQPDNAAYADAVANVFRQVLDQPEAKPHDPS